MNLRNIHLGIEAHDIWVAFSLLSRLPTPVDHARASTRGAAAAWAYPIVGLALGGMAGIIAAILLWLNIPAGMAAGAALATLAITSGGMHEDGLSDFADSTGGTTQAHRLEIMKDSHIGAFGATALILALLMRFSGIANLSGWGIIFGLAAIGAISRAGMVLVMHILPNARDTGLSARTGRPDINVTLFAVLIALASSLLLLGPICLLVVIIGFAATLPVAWYAKRSLGGQTGDVLGTAQQFGEIAALGALIALT